MHLDESRVAGCSSAQGRSFVRGDWLNRPVRNPDWASFIRSLELELAVPTSARESGCATAHLNHHDRSLTPRETADALEVTNRTVRRRLTHG
jgi:hypothetical protein